MHNSETLHIPLSSCSLQRQRRSCTWRKQLQRLLPQVLNHFHLPSCSALTLFETCLIDWIISTITLSGCISATLSSRAGLRSFVDANFPTNSSFYTCSSNSHISASGFSLAAISRREQFMLYLAFVAIFFVSTLIYTYMDTMHGTLKDQCASLKGIYAYELK